MQKKERFQRLIEYFSEHQPVAETELHYTNPYELLVAVILSAQCTDKRVNITTPAFFKRFPNPETLAVVSPEEVYPYIKSINYPNNKAKHLTGMATVLTEKFNGQMPSDVKDLQQLPGVGRKTAHVIASVVFNQPTLAVDTHVHRVSSRIGLTTHATTPLQTEKQLMQYLPKEKVAIAHHWLILHGRYVCKARKPACDVCGIKSLCNYYKKLLKEDKRDNLLGG